MGFMIDLCGPAAGIKSSLLLSFMKEGVFFSEENKQKTFISLAACPA
jgi:hypothetical protein